MSTAKTAPQAMAVLQFGYFFAQTTASEGRGGRSHHLFQSRQVVFLPPDGIGKAAKPLAIAAAPKLAKPIEASMAVDLSTIRVPSR